MPGCTTPPPAAMSARSKSSSPKARSRTSRTANSRTPLHVAAFLRRHVAARALLRLGANPNALDAQRYDIVTIAAVQDDLEMLKIALEGGGNPRAITSPYDGTALIAAAHLGHVGVVRTLIAAKAPLNHVNNLGWTALLEAVVLGNGGANHTAVVEALVNGRRRRQSLPIAKARRRSAMPAPAAIRRSRAFWSAPARIEAPPRRRATRLSTGPARQRQPDAAADQRHGRTAGQAAARAPA